MIRSKYLGLAAVAFAMLSLGACTTDSDSSAVTVKDFQICSTDGSAFDEAKTALTAGSSVAVYGEVTSDANLSLVEVVVKDPSGTPVLDLKNTTSATDYTFGPGKSNLITITTASNWVNGAYTVQLIATNANGATAQSTVLPLTITGGTGTTGSGITNVGTITVGSQASSESSFISLQDTTVENSTSANEEPGLIDLIYFFNAPGDTAFFYSPDEAYSEKLGKSSVQTWATHNSTTIYKTSKAASSFTTSAAVATEIAAGSGSGNKAQVANGGVYVVKFNGSHYAVLTVTGTPEATLSTSSIKVTIVE